MEETDTNKMTSNFRGFIENLHRKLPQQISPVSSFWLIRQNLLWFIPIGRIFPWIIQIQFNSAMSMMAHAISKCSYWLCRYYTGFFKPPSLIC